MRDIEFSEFWNGLYYWLSYFIEVWETWVFYIFGYLFVWYFSKKILLNIEKKVEESNRSNAKYKDIYPAIKQCILELKNSETKIFFFFIAGLFAISIYEKIFKPLDALENLTVELDNAVKVFSIVAIFAYNIFIHLIPNYSRFKTYKKLYKTLT